MDKVRIFISYDHKDDEYLQQLKVHLAPLVRNQDVTIWHDEMVPPGDLLPDAIKSELNKADLILLLVSHYYLDSDFFMMKQENQS